MDSDPRIVYITKYALTQGIWEMCEIKMEHVKDDKVMVVSSSGSTNGRMVFHGKDWHFTLEAAQARVKDMITAKLDSLRKEKSKLIALYQNGVEVVQLGSFPLS